MRLLSDLDFTDKNQITLDAFTINEYLIKIDAIYFGLNIYVYISEIIPTLPQ